MWGKLPTGALASANRRKAQQKKPAKTIAGSKVIRAGTSGKFTAHYTQSLSSNGSPHSGQNFGGCVGSAGCQPHLSQR